MMMKKMRFMLLALLLTAALLVTGCSGGGEENVAGTVEPAQNATEADVGGTVETQAPEENQVSLGRMEGGVYSNSYTGYGCELDSDWTFYTAEELQELPANTAELFENSDVIDSDDILAQITDMMAENANDLTSINVLYQKLSLQDRLAYATMSNEDVLDYTLEDQDAIIEAYEQAGFKVDTMEKVTVTFLGEERVALHTAMQLEGIGYYTLQLFDYDLGQYGVTLTLSSYMEDRTAELLDLFYAVE